MKEFLTFFVVVEFSLYWQVWERIEKEIYLLPSPQQFLPMSSDKEAMKEQAIAIGHLPKLEVRLWRGQQRF